VNRDDAQTARDTTYFLGRLLDHADLLPPDLVTILRDYERELPGSPPARWNGAGDPAQAKAIAARIAQSLTDNDPAVTACLADPARNRHAWAQEPATFRRALQILAAQGEITVKDGTYQPRTTP
jgi:hypothetical protein